MIKEDVFNLEVGRRISYIRKKRCLTQAIVADHINLSRASLANVENGRQALRAYNLMQLAEILEVEVKDLLPENSLGKFTNIVGLDIDKKQVLAANSLIAQFVKSL